MHISTSSLSHLEYMSHVLLQSSPYPVSSQAHEVLDALSAMLQSAPAQPLKHSHLPASVHLPFPLHLRSPCSCHHIIHHTPVTGSFTPEQTVSALSGPARDMLLCHVHPLTSHTHTHVHIRKAQPSSFSAAQSRARYVAMPYGHVLCSICTVTLTW